MVASPPHHGIHPSPPPAGDERAKEGVHAGLSSALPTPTMNNTLSQPKLSTSHPGPEALETHLGGGGGVLPHPRHLLPTDAPRPVGATRHSIVQDNERL